MRRHIQVTHVFRSFQVCKCTSNQFLTLRNGVLVENGHSQTLHTAYKHSFQCCGAPAFGRSPSANRRHIYMHVCRARAFARTRNVTQMHMYMYKDARRESTWHHRTQNVNTTPWPSRRLAAQNLHSTLVHTFVSVFLSYM